MLNKLFNRKNNRFDQKLLLPEVDGSVGFGWDGVVFNPPAGCGVVDWLRDPFNSGVNCELGARLSKIFLEGVGELRSNEYFLGWNDLYAVLRSPEFGAQREALNIPAETSARPRIASRGALVDPEFTLLVDGWVDPQGRPLVPAPRLKGRVLESGDRTGLLPEHVHLLLVQLERFHATPVGERTLAFKEQIFGHIRKHATASHCPLTFLAQHHFVQIDPDDPYASAMLSERGSRMIRVEQLLQHGEQSIWLDAFTLKRHAIHLMANPDPEYLLEDPAGRDFSPYTVAVVPARARSYYAFDEASRLRTLLSPDVLAELLAVFWPEAYELINEEIDHWEYALGRQGVQDLDYLSITFERDTLTLDPRADPQSTTLPAVLLPVLDLTTRFSRVEAFPWQVKVPVPVRQILELVSLGTVPGLAEHTAAEGAVSGESIVLSASLADEPPDLIGSTQLPHGLSATLSVRRFQVRCCLDQEAFHRQLHAQEGVRLFSAQHRATNAEAFA